MSFPRYPAYKDSGIPWVELIPSSWNVLPLCAVAKECDEPNHGMQENNLLSLSYGRIVQKDINSNDGLLPESFETYQIVQPNDIVLRLTDLQNDQRSLRSALVEQTGIITSAYLAVRPQEVAPRFLSHLLRAYDATKVFYSMGGGLRQSMKFADLKRLPVVLPPMEEQPLIATFLDHETAKIDALVAEQERLIELLKEKRQAVISHAVTKGLDPSAPMKDSGVEWLGEVPAHWGVVRLKHLVDESVAGPYGASLTKAMYSESGYRVYGQQQVIADDFSIGDYFISEEKYAEMRRYTVYEGDVLVSVMGTIGKVAVVTADAEPGIINPRLVRYRCNGLVKPRFLQRVLMCEKHQEHLSLESNGTTMEGLNMVTLGKVPVPTPPLNEQKQILSYLSERDSEFHPLIDEAAKAIELLQERRTTLISAAVTGQIDVRGWIPTETAH